ncbi:MAG TPA: hypothetical protein VFK05_17915 [Polyangiaceae bacterium]|nr:hypothetical protein [Polyangiaceae bacterium]
MSGENLRWRRALAAGVLGVSGVFTGLLGCQGIADIPDVSFSPVCKEYCDQEFAVCTSTDAQYPDYPTCMQVCGVLDGAAHGSTLDDSNTIACRLGQLAAAEPRGGSDRTDFCAASGPGGGKTCAPQSLDAPDCEGYCTLYNRACDGNSNNPFNGAIGRDQSGDLGACIEKCHAIRPATHAAKGDALPVPGYDFRAGALSGDTLGCRLYYASLAVADPSYCDTAGIRPSGPCLGSAVPDCSDYCLALGVACKDNLKVFESNPQCEAVCNATRHGIKQTVDEVDTIGCRTAHEFNALLIDPDTHCPHISPLGAGVCGNSPTGVKGGNCEAFCYLASQACPDEYMAEYTDDSDCQAKCADFEGADGNFNVSDANQGGDNLQCRTLNVSRALHAKVDAKAKPPLAEACPAVFGRGMCVDKDK